MISLVVAPPRAGTTVLMKACEAGGLPVRISSERDSTNTRASDGFMLHDGSLYELDVNPDTGTLRDFSRPDFEAWASGHVLKVMFTWLERVTVGKGPVIPVPALPVLTKATYRVAILERDHEELRQAQVAANILDVPVGWYATRYAWASEQLRRPDVASVQTVRYQDLVFRPKETLAALGWGLDAERAAAVVDATKYIMRNPGIGVPKHPDHPFLTVGL